MNRNASGDEDDGHDNHVKGHHGDHLRLCDGASWALAGTLLPFGDLCLWVAMRGERAGDVAEDGERVIDRLQGFDTLPTSRLLITSKSSLFCPPSNFSIFSSIHKPNTVKSGAKCKLTVTLLDTYWHVHRTLKGKN